MQLTPELARKYAAYRDRFLGGPLNPYAGWPSDVPDPCPSAEGRRYQKDDYAPFMVIAGDPLINEGTFLHVDVFRVDNAEDPSSYIRRIGFGDNTVYASVALVNFVAEYAITNLSQPLEIALGIARSLQRLGGWQRGFGETGGAPFGFTLRADSRDWTDPGENFCNFDGGEGPAAFALAPSLDQYSTILSCCCFAKVLLEESPGDADHQEVREELLRVLSERVERIVEYIAFDTIYTIRWEADGTLRQPEDNRGPYCHVAAYPFARIAARVLEGDPSQYGEYLGEVGLATVRDLTVVLLDQISIALREQVVQFLRDTFVRFFRNTISGEVFEAIAKFVDLVGIVIDKFNNEVLGPVIEHIIDPLIQHVVEWRGNPVTGPISDFLAQQFFDLFVAGVLLDTSDRPLFQDSVFRLNLGQLFEWIGGVELPDSIPIDVSFDFAPSKPGWWNETILGDWPAPSWHFDFASFDIPVGDLPQIPISIPFTGLLRKLAAVSRGKAYLKFLAYNLLAGGELFGEIPDVDARDLAVKYDNAWFMALAHRFEGVGTGEPGVMAVLNILESAPDTFPRGKGAGHWNQDFRWIRDIEDKNDDTLYSGLDLMAPLMVACSTSADLTANRETLLDALTPSLKEGNQMGPFTLPFQGPIAEKKLLEPRAGGTQTDTIVYVGVVFDRPVGNGVVRLTIPTLNGGTEEVEFRQDDRNSRLVAAPLTDLGIVIKEATATARGYIVMSTD